MNTSTQALPGNYRRPAIAGLCVIALTFGGLGSWSAIAKLDSAVMASGSVIVETERKVVQHYEGGIVSEILVRENERVREGDVLLRIDATQARAGSDMTRNMLVALLAEEARLAADLARADKISFPDEIGDDSVGLRAKADQENQRAGHRESRAGERRIMGERIQQISRQIEGFAHQRASIASQVASITDELDALRPLFARGLVPITRMNPLERSLTDLQGRMGSIDSEIARLEGQADEFRLQISGIDARIVEDASAKLSDVRARIAEARQRVVVSDDVLVRSEVRAPRSGSIVGLSVHTIGAVVRAGDLLMEIVPDDEAFAVSARMSPLDITHVHAGLAAEIRLPAFKSRHTPYAVGEIRSISADVMRDEMTGQPYYDLRISVKSDAFPDSIRDRLVAGMQAEVVIPTGERTVIDYLTQPLVDNMRRGMREQ